MHSVDNPNPRVYDFTTVAGIFTTQAAAISQVRQSLLSRPPKDNIVDELLRYAPTTDIRCEGLAREWKRGEGWMYDASAGQEMTVWVEEGEVQGRRMRQEILQSFVREEEVVAE